MSGHLQDIDYFQNINKFQITFHNMNSCAFPSVFEWIGSIDFYVVLLVDGDGEAFTFCHCNQCLESGEFKVGKANGMHETI